MKSLPPDDDHCGELWDCLQHQSGQLWTRFWHQHIPRARFSGTLQLSLSKLEVQKSFHSVFRNNTIFTWFSKKAFLVCVQNRPEVKFFLPRQSSQRLWLTRSDSIWSLKTRCVFVFFLFNCFFLLLLFFDEAGLHIIPQDQMDVFCCCCWCTCCCCCRLIRWYGCCVRRYYCLLSFFSVKANSVKPGFPGKVFHCHFQCSSWSLLIYIVSSNFFFKTN